MHAKSSGKKHVMQQSVTTAIWSVCDIVHRGNAASALQYVPARRGELLELIEIKGREVAEAIAALCPTK
jgi:hypothetical protein